MNNLSPASQTKRMLNWIIDGIIIGFIWFGLFIPALYLLSLLGLHNWLEKGEIYSIDFTLVFVLIPYYIISEGIFKTTIGKLITRSKLIKADGNEIKFYDALLRTLCRLIPLEQLSFLSRNPIGWHDELTNTRVIDKKASGGNTVHNP